MKTLKALSVTTLLGVAALGLVGCSAAQKGAAGGGLIGGATGAAVGNATIAAPVTGAVVGAAGGAAVGGLAGDAYEQVSRADQEREMENLRAQVQAKEAELLAMRESGMTPEAVAELEAARTELDTLRAALDAAQKDNELALATRAAADEQLVTKDARINELQAAVDEKNATLGTLEADLAASREAAAAEAARLEGELASLRDQLAAKEATLAKLDGEVNVLRTSLTGKEQQLSAVSDELKQMNVQLEETTRGLTLTIVDSLLYQPGEAELTKDGQALIGEVARVINENFPNRELLIEGHTDNQPIVRSGWHSNWELGAARALTLLHELVGKHSVDPARISATSFGEFRPAAANTTPEGRRANRRAVIVILPEKLPLQRESLAQAN